MYVFSFREKKIKVCKNNTDDFTNLTNSKLNAYWIAKKNLKKSANTFIVIYASMHSLELNLTDKKCEDFILPSLRRKIFLKNGK